MNTRKLSLTKIIACALITVSSLYGVLEQDKRIEILQHILPKNPVIVEAGACDGNDTVQFAQLWPNAEIFAFEPVPHTYEELKKKADNYHNIIPFNYALNTYTGTAELFVCTNNNGASSLLQPTALIQHLQFEPTTITVPCITLKKWADMHAVDSIDLLWLDCEGHELAILKASEVLINNIGAIHIEANFKEFRKNTVLFEELKTWLKNHNFTQVWQSTENTSWQADILFLKTSTIDNNIE